MQVHENSLSVEVGAFHSLKANDVCPDQAPYSLYLVMGVTAAAAILSLYAITCCNRRKLSLGLPNFSSLSVTKASADSMSKAARVAYIGKGRDRMSVELCQTCIESNKMLSQLAIVTGSNIETFEPCDLCR